MRLEVLVDKQEPLIYPLDKEQILIGSSENCDIMLKVEGISRKHALLICNVDEFFIIDQGSTNGTFINEERLVPGRRFEFTSFFPVRLGESVLLTLLSDDESHDLKLSKFHNEDKSSPNIIDNDSMTRVTKLSPRANLTREATLKLETHKKKVSNKYRSKVQLKKPVKKVSKEDKKLNIVILAAIGIFLGTLYFQMNQDIPVAHVPQVAQVGDVETPKEVVPAIPLVAANSLKPIEQLNTIKNDFKCFSELEKKMCELFKLSAPFGVTQQGLDFHVFLDGNIEPDFFDEYFQRHKVDPNRSKTLTVLYLLKNPIVYPEEVKDYRFHLHFLDGEQNIIAGGAYFPKAAEQLIGLSGPTLVKDVLINGEMILDFTQEYLRFYPEVKSTRAPTPEVNSPPIESEVKSPEAGDPNP